MGDSIKPGKVSVGEVSCCSTGSAYLDCQKNQSTSSISSISELLSLLDRSLLLVFFVVFLLLLVLSEVGVAACGARVTVISSTSIERGSYCDHIQRLYILLLLVRCIWQRLKFD